MMYDELIEQLRIRASWLEFAIIKTPSKTEGNRDAILFRKAAYAINDLITALTASNEVIAKSKPKWIPVTERLPKGGDESGQLCDNIILLLSVKYNKNYVTAGWINGVTKKVYYLDEKDDYIHKTDMSVVKAWMPLPQPPESDGEK